MSDVAHQYFETNADKATWYDDPEIESDEDELAEADLLAQLSPFLTAMATVSHCGPVVLVALGVHVCCSTAATKLFQMPMQVFSFGYPSVRPGRMISLASSCRHLTSCLEAAWDRWVVVAHNRPS